jgi:phytoene/squalene synthetase
MTWGPIRGPVLLIRGLLADRVRPDLESLARERDPERFVWRVLPHAARSFAASIVVLPADQARAAAVAYLYCRMLDTYEDLIPEPEDSIAELRRFSARFGEAAPAPPPAIPEDRARDHRDRVYLLLLSRCALVDAVFETLPPEVRERIGDLVASMAEGMAWSTEAMAGQGGTLRDAGQLERYCRNVIGHPALFTLRLVDGHELSEPAREDALEVSEMIQLANVSRDIERDLARGIAYHPALEPYLGTAGERSEREAAIRRAREDYLAMALARAPAYRRLFVRLELGSTATVRTAAVLMLLFTDLHYRWCALRTGNPSWPGPRSRLGVLAASVPALISRRWASRVLERVEADFAAAAARLAAESNGAAAPRSPAGERSPASGRIGAGARP